jgi:CheY-like chemotaxis protein
LREPSVLVVDDEVLVEMLIRDALEAAGYSVISTCSAAEALQLLENADHHWAGVVTDINLGEGAPLGWDIARRAREVTPAVPVIYVSADSSQQWTAQGVPLSIMISKPFAPSRVVVALADLLNARAGDI